MFIFRLHAKLDDFDFLISMLQSASQFLEQGGCVNLIDSK